MSMNVTFLKKICKVGHYVKFENWLLSVVTVLLMNIQNLKEGKVDEVEVIILEAGVVAVTIVTTIMIMMEDMADMGNLIWGKEWAFQDIPCLYTVSKTCKKKMW